MKKDTQNILQFIKHSTLALVGFILSPLSWWNDLFINVPFSFLFAYLCGGFLHNFMVITKAGFIFLFLVGYWASNILGIILMEKGVRSLTAKKAISSSLYWNLAITGVYSVAVTVIIYTDYHNILSSLNIIPSWVQR